MDTDMLASGSRPDTTGRNWYKWNIANWGTKWNAYNVNLIKNEGDTLIVQFDTAWSTPDPVIQTLAQWFPELRIMHEYFDEGWNFWGIDTWRGHLSHRQQESDYDTPEKRALWKRLCIELKGYDPEKDEEETESTRYKRAA